MVKAKDILSFLAERKPLQTFNKRDARVGHPSRIDIKPERCIMEITAIQSHNRVAEPQNVPERVSLLGKTGYYNVIRRWMD